MNGISASPPTTGLAVAQTTRRARRTPLRSLAVKDLRLLLPFLIGLGCLHLLGVVVVWLMETPGPKEWVLAGGNLPDTGDDAYFALALALLAAFPLFPGEREVGTQAFVATLPVGSRAITLTKFGVLAAVIIASGWLDVATGWFFTALNPDSIVRRQLQPMALAAHLTLTAVTGLIAAAHAVWLSRYRRFAWLLFGIIVLLGKWLPSQSPWLSGLGLESVSAPEHHGGDLVWPVAALLLHLTLAAAGLWRGVVRWDAEDRLPAARAVVRPRLRKVVGIAASLVALLVLLGVAVRYFWSPALDDEDAEASEAATPDAELKRIETAHFVFSYSPQHADAARALAAEAEPIYERLRRLIGAELPERTVVDLTFRATELEGLAVKARINMDMTGQRPGEHRKAVFTHELVHVFQFALAGQARIEQLAALRFLAEGWAEYVGFSLPGAPLSATPQRQAARLRAAWAHKRYRIRLEELFDPAAFSQLYDERWLYDLGERWVAAWVAVCGVSAPAKFYRRLGDTTLPKSLEGSALVRSVLTLDRCSFDAVESRYETDLREDHAAAEALPSVRARWRGRRSGRFQFDIAVAAADPSPRTVEIVVRADASAHPRDYIILRKEVTPGSPDMLEATGFRPGPFQYRVGVQPAADQRPLYTRWRMRL